MDEVGVAKAMVEDVQSDRIRVQSIRQRFSIIWGVAVKVGSVRMRVGAKLKPRSDQIYFVAKAKYKANVHVAWANRMLGAITGTGRP